MEKASQHKAHTGCGMGCSGSRLFFGGLCSGQAAGVLGLDLQPELLSRHEVIGHGRRVGGGLFIERYLRLLLCAIVLSATPQVANHTLLTIASLLAVSILDNGQCIEPVELGVQQRRLDAMNIVRQVSHIHMLSNRRR